MKPAILIIGGLILGVGLTLAVLRFYQPPASLLPTPTPSLSPSPSPTATPVVSASPTPVADQSALIKQAVYAATGLTPTQAEVAITQNTGTHAKGNIKEFDAVGGAYWLAAKTSSGWVVAYDGQSTPLCSQVNPYNFPASMVPECFNPAGKLLTR